MISLDNFQDLQRKVERAKQARDHARGRLAQLKDRLKKEYGVETVAEAQELLEQYKERELKHSAKYTAARAAFDEKYSTLLEKA